MKMEKVNSKIQRKTNMELLRIVSMILIVMHHYCVHSSFIFENGISINKFIIQALSIGGKIGVNIFILITGYFMINSKFKVKKLLKLLLEIFTYSFLIFVIIYIINPSKVNIKLLLKSIFPVTYSLYWFPTTYILLYILSPFINKFIENSNKNTIIKLLIVLLIIQVIIPTFTNANLNFSNLIWFTTLYMIGACIHIYNIDLLKRKNIKIAVLIICSLFIFMSIVAIDIISIKIPSIEKYTDYFSDINKLPAVIISILLFTLFKEIKIKNYKFINNIASSTFAVYLIHDNVILSPIIWCDILKAAEFFNSRYLIIHLLISVFLVFNISIIIDKMKKVTIDKAIKKIIDKITDKYRPKYIAFKAKLDKFIDEKI